VRSQREYQVRLRHDGRTRNASWWQSSTWTEALSTTMQSTHMADILCKYSAMKIFIKTFERNNNPTSSLFKMVSLLSYLIDSWLLLHLCIMKYLAELLPRSSLEIAIRLTISGLCRNYSIIKRHFRNALNEIYKSQIWTTIIFIIFSL